MQVGTNACAGVCAEDTIITWSDPELGTDIALSFQEAVGCSYIWCAAVCWAPGWQHAGSCATCFWQHD
jgi:hypothetical protein